MISVSVDIFKSQSDTQTLNPGLLCSPAGANCQGPGDRRAVWLPAQISHRTGPALQRPAGTVSPLYHCLPDHYLSPRIVLSWSGAECGIEVKIS